MYHQHQIQQEQQQQPPLPPQQQQKHGHPSSNTNTDKAAPSSASNLDHALLESLFYNEMAMFEPDAGQEAPSAPTEHDTPHTIVEKEILRDFGVWGGTTLFPSNDGIDTAQNNNTNASSYTTGVMEPVAPMQQQHQSVHNDQQQQSNPLHHQAPLSTAIPQYANNISTAYDAPNGGGTTTNIVPTHTISTALPATNTVLTGNNPQPEAKLGMVYMDTQATATAAAAAAAMISGGSNREITSLDTTLKSASLSVAHPSPTGVAQSAASYSNSHQVPPMNTPQNVPHSNGVLAQQQLKQETMLPGGEGVSVPSGTRVQVPQDRARQLVDQFATLASRLGIDLPNSVLQSLTSAATKNDPTLLSNPPCEPQTNGTVAGKVAATSTTARSAKGVTKSTICSKSAMKYRKPAATPANDSSESPAMAPTVMELRNMAEEAIAAVTQSNTNCTASTETLPRGAPGNNSNSTGGSDNKPTYSKRRKKPRLSDCEAKLAQLKAENEQLKRHLQNVSNKAHKFDKEKEEASKQIARLMHDRNAGPKEMEQSVRKFSDMYSDYGINRQHELSFHLDQLQRLVNPTNFTKMGLWTLGQSSQNTKKNPIAGILVKELDITPQQGRKILEQSEKIRKLCDNLKEAHTLLVTLKHLCEKKTRTFQDRMNKCTEILTSEQVVKLIIWINGNTQLLEKVCPGWGTEHIQSKK